MPHPRSFVAFGALAGAVGGLLAFVFARVFAEPLIQQAVDYETGRHEAQEALDRVAGVATGEHEHEIFSRAVQGNLGAGVGLVLFGVAMGLLVAVVSVVLLGRVGRLGPRSLALLIAGGGFLAVYFVPFLKYPANPPAIGREETITTRGTLYLVLVGASSVLLIVAVAVGRRLQGRLGTWNAALAGGAVFVVAVGIVLALLPSFPETPLPLRDADGTIVFPGFPADVLAGFRLYSLLAQVIFWGAIGLAFGALAERLLTPSRRRTTPAAV